MRQWWVWATATLLTACAGPTTGPDTPAPPEPTPIQRLAAFLPALADYAAADFDAWVVEQHTGSEHARLDYPRIGDTDRVEPPGCASPPYAATSDLTADVIGRETNLGPTGFGPEVSIRLVRHPAGDPVAAARDWARGCHDILVVDDTSGYRQPVATSVLPSVDVDGTEMLRILRVDNRVQRYQPEGRREHLVTVAVVGDVAVYGYSHDDLALSERLMALTIRRLRDGRPAAAPTADPAPPATSSLAGAGAVRLARLLPTTADLGPDWLVAQRLPMFDTREEYYRSDPAVTPAGCDVPALLTTINLPQRRPTHGPARPRPRLHPPDLLNTGQLLPGPPPHRLRHHRPHRHRRPHLALRTPPPPHRPRRPHHPPRRQRRHRNHPPTPPRPRPTPHQPLPPPRTPTAPPAPPQPDHHRSHRRRKHHHRYRQRTRRRTVRTPRCRTPAVPRRC